MQEEMTSMSPPAVPSILAFSSMLLSATCSLAANRDWQPIKICGAPFGPKSPCRRSLCSSPRMCFRSGRSWMLGGKSWNDNSVRKSATEPKFSRSFRGANDAQDALNLFHGAWLLAIQHHRLDNKFPLKYLGARGHREQSGIDHLGDCLTPQVGQNFVWVNHHCPDSVMDAVGDLGRSNPSGFRRLSSSRSGSLGRCC